MFGDVSGCLGMFRDVSGCLGGVWGSGVGRWQGSPTMACRYAFPEDSKWPKVGTIYRL